MTEVEPEQGKKHLVGTGVKLAFTVSFQGSGELKLFSPTCLSLLGFIRGKKVIHNNLLAY